MACQHHPSYIEVAPKTTRFDVQQCFRKCFLWDLGLTCETIQVCVARLQLAVVMWKVHDATRDLDEMQLRVFIHLFPQKRSHELSAYL